MIDLKAQFENILKTYGHKVIYRRYHPGQKSSYYSPVTREGVGGERWSYTDEVILCRHSPTTVRGTKGAYEGKMVYYLPANIKPKVKDVIIEVGGSNTPSVADSQIKQSTHKQVLRIEDIDPKRGLNGDIVYYTVYVKPEYGYY